MSEEEMNDLMNIVIIALVCPLLLPLVIEQEGD